MAFGIGLGEWLAEGVGGAVGDKILITETRIPVFFAKPIYRAEGIGE